MADLYLDEDENIIWQEYKRILKIPYPFTKYTLTNKRIFVESGVLRYRLDEIKLFRICDITVTRNLFERIFSTGSIIVRSTDRTSPSLTIGSVLNYGKGRQQIASLVDTDRKRVGFSTGEFIH